MDTNWVLGPVGWAYLIAQSYLRRPDNLWRPVIVWLGQLVEEQNTDHRDMFVCVTQLRTDLLKVVNVQSQYKMIGWAYLIGQFYLRRLDNP
jgi:hypothetical protein